MTTTADKPTIPWYRRCLRKFDRFLFESCDPSTCSLMRIAYALLLIVYVLAWLREARLWFSDAGALRAATVEQFGHGAYESLLFQLPTTSAVVTTCLTILLIQTVLLLFGCWSRFQMACIFVWLVSFQHRNPLITDGQDVLIRLLSFYMIFMPLDNRWSLTRYLESKRQRGANRLENIQPTCKQPPSAWAVRLVQFQISAMYISTVLAKWEGITWRNGTAVYFVSRMDDLFHRFWLPDVWFETLWIAKSLTWGVLAVEALLPLLLWLPATRRWGVCLAFVLHLSIEYSMHLFLFEWAMLVGLLSFTNFFSSPRDAQVSSQALVRSSL